MKNTRRRFEVLLPLQFNDGRMVPDELLADAVREIVGKFAGASYQAQPIEGHWVHEGVYYREQHVKVIVDVSDTATNRHWMRGFKARWKAKLEQLELWVVSYRIDVE
jgi:hypothetical protein